MPTHEEFLAFNRGVIADFRAHGGVVEQPPFPTVLITTTGARSGTQTTTPMAYGVDNERLFVVASAGGANRHRAWYQNMLVHPDVTVEFGPGIHQARAAVIHGRERHRLYDLICQLIPAFGGYERMTERAFPASLTASQFPSRAGDDVTATRGHDVGQVMVRSAGREGA